MRVIICDDDETVRSLLADLVEEAGGEVLAEAEHAVEALRLIDHHSPDLVLLDLNLRHGSGMEVIEHLRTADPRPGVIVFTAYDVIARVQDDFVTVVHKPDFELLARRLASWTPRTGDRRQPGRDVTVGPASGVDDPHDFYRLLAEAWPTDLLVFVAADDGDAPRVAGALRQVLRSHDRVLQRSDGALALLLGARPGALATLCDRLRTDVPDVDARLRSVEAGDDPAAAFARITG